MYGKKIENLDGLNNGGEDKGTITRRGVLTGLATLGISGTSAQAANILEISERNLSIDSVGESEVSFFEQYFGISHGDGIGFLLVVQSFQRENNLVEDGVIGPKTLEELYIRTYDFNWEKLGDLQKWRLDSYKVIGFEYPDWNRYVAEKGRVATLRVPEEKIPQVFNKGYYFGVTEGEPINGGFINSDIINKVPSSIAQMGVKGFLSQIEGKFIITIYVNGDLQLASYSSPGDVEKYGSSAATPQLLNSVNRIENNIVGELTSHIHYISGGSDSVRNTPNIDGSFDSDPMPFACGIKINEGIYTHAGMVDAGPRSHGCPRLPCHYARGVHEIFKQHGIIDWDTRWSQNQFV